MKKIIITEDRLIVNDKGIPWEEIIGVREFTSSVLRHVGTRSPFAELFLIKGKVIKFNANIELMGMPLKDYSDPHKKKFRAFFSLLEEIHSRAGNMKEPVSSWIEWRLMLPVILIQLGVLVVGLIVHTDIVGIVMKAIIASLAVLPFSWFWERRARVKHWK